MAMCPKAAPIWAGCWRGPIPIGNSDMRVLLKHRPGAVAACDRTAENPGALLLSPPAAVILAASPNRRAIPLQKLFRAAGKLSAMAGTRYNEYAVIHGE